MTPSTVNFRKFSFFFILLFIGGCSLFNRTSIKNETDTTRVSGTVILPGNTAIVTQIKSRGLVNFLNLQIFINGNSIGAPDTFGNYSSNSVRVASTYLVEVKNKNNLTLLRSLSLSSGVINVNTSTTAIALIFSEALKSNPNTSLNSISSTSTGVLFVVAALEAILVDANSLALLSSGATDIFSLQTVVNAVQSALTTLSTTTSTFSSTSTSSTSSSSSSTTTTTGSTSSFTGASSFIPASGTIGVTTTQTLSWTVASDALSTVLLNADASATTSILTASTSVSVQPSLSGSTTYFWKVNSTLGSTTVNGSELNFTTLNGFPALASLTSTRQGALSMALSLTFTDDSSLAGDNISSLTIQLVKNQASTTNTITKTAFDAATPLSFQQSPNSLTASISLYGLTAGTQNFIHLIFSDKAGQISSTSTSIASFPTLATFTTTSYSRSSGTFSWVFNDEVTSLTITLASGATPLSPGAATLTFQHSSAASFTSFSTTTTALITSQDYTPQIFFQHGSTITASSQPTFTK